MNNEFIEDPGALGPLLLETGMALLRAGASSSRIVLTTRRIAAAYNLDTHIDLGPRIFSVTLLDREHDTVFSGTRGMSSAPGVNSKIISGISRMSWSITENPWTFDQIRAELKRLMGLSHYPKLLVLSVVGLAGASFCYTFGGNPIQMVLVFLATFIGLFVKQELIKKAFNPYIVTYLSASTAALTIALFWRFGLDTSFEQAFATSVLFLIPGVPLFTSVVDMIDGYILNGIERGINALMHAFAIALGLATLMYIFKVQV